MQVRLIDHMGSDLTVVNAARVSFAKKSAWEDTSIEVNPGEYLPRLNLKEEDARLINYLAKHNHWTPFAHPQITFHIKAPIFVARQLGKHQVGMVWNEVSRRYVDTPPELYEPAAWRARADSVKQGSSDEHVDLSFYTQTGAIYTEEGFAPSIEEELWDLTQCSIRVYEGLLHAGVCPEQARMVLPQSMYTEWYWTGSLAAWARVCKLRLDPHTQKETQEVAKQIAHIVEGIFPVSWKALLNAGN